MGRELFGNPNPVQAETRILKNKDGKYILEKVKDSASTIRRLATDAEVAEYLTVHGRPLEEVTAKAEGAAVEAAPTVSEIGAGVVPDSVGTSPKVRTRSRKKKEEVKLAIPSEE